MVALAIAERADPERVGAALGIEHVNHAFDIDGAVLPVLEDVNLLIQPGESSPGAVDQRCACPTTAPS